jgi:hypothetical protein
MHVVEQGFLETWSKLIVVYAGAIGEINVISVIKNSLFLCLQS